MGIKDGKKFMQGGKEVWKDHLLAKPLSLAKLSYFQTWEGERHQLARFAWS